MFWSCNFDIQLDEISQAIMDCYYNFDPLLLLLQFRHKANKDNTCTNGIVLYDNDWWHFDTDLTSVFQVQAKMVVTTHDVCMASHLSAHSTEMLSPGYIASSSGKFWTNLVWFGQVTPTPLSRPPQGTETRKGLFGTKIR